MNIVLLGAPASGKGTQAEMVAKKFSLYHLQTGKIARELASKDERIKEMVNSGKLIPENEMTMYVMDLLKEEKPQMQNILFEGFPRFISQYEALESFLKNKGDDIDAVISLDINKDEAVRRISSRVICPKCGEVFNLVTNPPKENGVCDKCASQLVQRDDDKPESIEKRFEYYENNTEKLMEYLDNHKKLVRVDGNRPIDTIFEDLSKFIETLK